jgi:hypothetical protein
MTSAAPSMMKIGLVKPIAVVSASGMCGRAMNHNISPEACTTPRPRKTGSPRGW